MDKEVLDKYLKELEKILATLDDRVNTLERIVYLSAPELIIFATTRVKEDTEYIVYVKLTNEKKQVLLELSSPIKKKEEEALKVVADKLQETATFYPVGNVVLRTNLDMEVQYNSLFQWLDKVFNVVKTYKIELEES